MYTFKAHLFYGLLGLLMGLVLSGSGFSDYAEVYKMFTFSDFRLLFGFAGAVGIALLVFPLLTRKHKVPRKALNKGTIPGSIMFGIGWALTGACPAISLVQLGEGQLAALATIAGILFGVWLFRRMQAGGVQVDTGICGE